ncbi:MAG: hypothetical protein ACK419_07960 [Pyrinomonadaceae bacterium]
MKKLSHSANFEELFNSAVDKAMLLLEESGRQAIYYHIEKTFGLERNMWHKDVERFAETLEQIFGLGAELLLKAIVKELYSNLGLKFEEDETFHFPRLVQRVKKGIRQKR